MNSLTDTDQVSISDSSRRAISEQAGWKPALIIACSMFYFLAVAHDYSEQMFLAAAVGVVALSILLYRLWSGRVHWFESGIITGMFFFLQYANGAVTAHYYPEIFLVRGNLDDRLVADLILLLAGLLAFVLGYALPIGRTLGRRGPQLRRDFSGRRFFWLWLLAITAAWGIRVFESFEIVSQEVLSSYINLPQLLIPIGVMAWVRLIREEGRKLLPALWIGCAFVLEISYQLPTTMKGNLFNPILYSILGVYLITKRMPAKTLLIMLLALVIWIPIGLFFRDYRFTQPWIPVGTALAYSIEDARAHDPEELAQYTWLYLLQRFQMIDVFDSVVTHVPSSVPYKYGETYADIPLMLIPRALWSEKPVFRYMKGEWGQEFAGVTPETEAVGMGMVAEFYFNFGPVGIMAGMLAFGIFCRALWAWYHERNREHLPAAILYLVIMKQLTAIGALATVVVGLIQYGLMFLVFYLIAAQPHTQREKRDVFEKAVQSGGMAIR